MTKFKQRVLVIFFFLCVGIFYLWSKIKARNSRRNPVVKISRDEYLLQSLLLDGAYDFNNLDHVHKNKRILSKDKRSTKATDRNEKLAKGIATITQNNRATSNLRTKSKQNLILNKPAWLLWQDMVKEREVTQPGQEGKMKVDAIVKALQTVPVIQTSVGYKGTQLKASMFLKGNQRTVFKPKR
jgi:hypothetical protein